MLTLTLTRLTETANKLFVDFYWEKMQRPNLGGLDIHSSIQFQVSK